MTRLPPWRGKKSPKIEPPHILFASKCNNKALELNWRSGQAVVLAISKRKEDARELKGFYELI